MLHAVRFIMTAILVTVLAPTSRGADITVTPSTQYQTIEGFGAYLIAGPWKVKSGPFWVDVNIETAGFYDSMVSELGVTMWRTNVADAADSFNPAPDVFNPRALRNFGTSIISNSRRLIAEAREQREPVNFYTSCWTPPSWMKVGGIAACLVEGAPNLRDENASTCRLSVGMETQFAKFLEKFVRTWQDSTGMELYGLSIQDEPAFTEPYESCWWSTARYREGLKVVGKHFRDNGLNTGFIAAEDMSWAFPTHYEAYIRQDAEALGYVKAWGVHGYTDGVRSDTGAYRGETPTDKPLWQCETSGDGYGTGVNDWSGAMVLARDILKYLREGRMTMWTWWSLQEVVSDITTAEGVSGLVLNGTPTAKYYASRHFYRFIRPGARQVASTSSDAELQVAAFHHVANNCRTVVMVNTGSSEKTVNVNGFGTSQFLMEVSTETSKRSQQTVSATGITVPARSIVTLVSGTYAHTEPVSIKNRPSASTIRAVPAQIAGRARTYALNGRSIRNDVPRMRGVVIQATGGARAAVMVR